MNSSFLLQMQMFSQKYLEFNGSSNRTSSESYRTNRAAGAKTSVRMANQKPWVSNKKNLHRLDDIYISSYRLHTYFILVYLFMFS